MTSQRERLTDEELTEFGRFLSRTDRPDVSEALRIGQELLTALRDARKRLNDLTTAAPADDNSAPPAELLLCAPAHRGCDTWLWAFRVFPGPEDAPVALEQGQVTPVKYVRADVVERTVVSRNRYERLWSRAWRDEGAAALEALALRGALQRVLLGGRLETAELKALGLVPPHDG